MKPFVNIVDEIVGDLNNRDINGKKFSDEFQIEGIPLWWFYRRFITSHVLPRQFNTIHLLEKKRINLLERIYYQSIELSFRTYFKYNEHFKIKLKHQKKKTENIIKKDNRKVLFLSYTNHLNTTTGEVYRINSLLQKMKEGGDIEPFVLFVDPLSLHSYHKIKGLEHTIYQYCGEEEQQHAEKIALSLSKTWCSLDKRNLLGEHWELLQYTLNFFFSKEFIYYITLYYLAMKRLLQEESIQCLVLTSRNGFFEKCLIAAAHKQEVPLVVIQHGMGMGTSDPELFPNMKMAVFGKAYYEKLLEWGVDKNDIKIIGPIIFENIHKFIQQNPQKTNKILLITDQYVEENYLSKEEYFEKMKIILQQLHSLGKEIIVKLHPVEKHLQGYISLITQEGFKNITVTQERGSEILYRLINDSDLVVNSYSTVALEAMILGKPILTINIGPNLVPDISSSIFAGGIHVTIDDDIAKKAQEALDNSPSWKKKRKEIVQNFCYKIDGKAGERLVELIHELMNERKI